MKALDQKTKALDEFVVKGLSFPKRFWRIARGHVATRYRNHEDRLSEVASTFHSSISTLQDNVAQTRKSLTHNTNIFATNTDARTVSIREFESHSSGAVKTLKTKLIKHELLDDVPTSETPKKRDYPIPSAWPLTKPHAEILDQVNKMPLGNVNVNLTAQTPGTLSRIRNAPLDDSLSTENSFEKKLMTPSFEKGLVLEKITSEGRENSTVFKSKIAAPSRKRVLGSH